MNPIIRKYKDWLNEGDDNKNGQACNVLGLNKFEVFKYQMSLTGQDKEMTKEFKEPTNKVEIKEQKGEKENGRTKEQPVRKTIRRKKSSAK